VAPSNQPEPESVGAFPKKINLVGIRPRKCPISDAGHTGRDCDTGQGRVQKPVFTNAGHRVRYGNIGQSPAGVECTLLDGSHTTGNHHIIEAGAVLERIIADTGEAAAEGNTGQTGKVKRVIADTGHGIWDGDVCQGGAVMKGIRADRGNARWNDNACEHGAELKGAGRHRSE